MPRRLVNRSAPSTSRPTSTSTSLPEYQPPSCHHSPSHRLTDIPSSRAATASTALLKRSLQDASRNLAHSADDLQARLRERRNKLAQLERRREEKGTGKSVDEEALEEHVEKLERIVRELTEKQEGCMRRVVDSQAVLEDEEQVLKDLETEFTNRRPPAPPAADGEDEAAPPTNGPLEVYNSLRAGKRSEYNSMTPHERYALNNDYATFKKLWHLGLVGEDGPPLPDASRWFDARGNPVLSHGSATAEHGAGDGSDGVGDEDDDIEVAREVVSLICPLTQSEMKEPYSNRRCKHTFEKEAIQHHLRVSDTAQCPQTGCSQMFNFRDFKDDFFLDQTMLRRIQHANEGVRRDYDDSRMYDEDDEDENLISDTSGLPGAEEEEVPRGARSVSRVPKRERRSMGRA